MKKIIAISCLMILFTGCSKKSENGTIPSPIQDIETTSKSVTPDPMVTEKTKKSASHQNKTVEIQDHHGWYKVFRDGHIVERCFDFSGCIEGKKKVLPGVIKRSDGLFCGSSSAHVGYVQGYRCDSKRGAAVCTEETCQCGDTEILGGEICDGTVDGDTFASDSERFIPIDDVAPSKERLDETLKPMPNQMLRTCGKDRVITDDGSHKEFSCLEIDESDDEGSMNHGYWYCQNQNGCRTPDGRIYNPLSRIHPDSIEDPYDFCMYHLIGNEDTTDATLCRSGDCVFPEETDPNQRLAAVKAYTQWLPDGFEFKCDKTDPAGKCQFGKKCRETGCDAEGFVIDTLTCEGGTRYCHGRNNKPMKAPANPDGFECRQQYQLPETPLFIDLTQNALRAWTCTKEYCECGGQKCPQNAVCLNESCYCAGKPVDMSLDYACDIAVSENNDSKSVEIIQRCSGEHCPCGNGTCSLNEVCVDGQCLCRQKIKPSNSIWRCEDSGRPNDKAVWRCSDPQGCVCGENKCPMNAQCIDGACTCRNEIDIQPGKHYACEDGFWVCKSDASCTCYGGTASAGDRCPAPYCRQNQTISPDGCMCGDKPALPGYDYECMKSEKFGYVNTAKEDRVLCGTTKCDEGMYCIDAKCVIPDISDGMAAHRYWTTHVIIGSESAKRCEKENGCFCGTERCEQNYYCIDGQCAAAEYSFIRNDRRYSFSLLQNEEYDNNEEYIVEQAIFERWRACDAMQNLDYSPTDPRSFEEVYPIDYAHSDRIDDYRCIVSGTHSEFEDDASDAFDEYTEEEGFMTLDQYLAIGLECPKDVCMCGETQCPSTSKCQCRYELETHQIHCGCISSGCGDSAFSELEGYECISDFGLVCQKETCECGSARCPRGSICLSDGLCTPTVIKP